MFIYNIMGKNYFYFAFSTAVMKSTVEPSDGHSSAATAPCAQLWSIVALCS